MKKTYLLIAIMCLMASLNSNAQNWKNLFNNDNLMNVVESVASEYIDFNIVGTWNYTGSAIKLESSESNLSEIGGSVVATSIEEKINNNLTKLGIEPGSMTFIFNQDLTMSIVSSRKTFEGTYSYDKEAKKLEMKIGRFGRTTTADVEVKMSDFDILFKSDALLSIVKAITGKINLKSMDNVGKLMDNYDGMKMGFSFEKQK